MISYVINRNGEKEAFNVDKITKQIEKAYRGLDDISVSEIELSLEPHLEDGMKTSDINEILSKTIADMISEKRPDYQYVSARIAIDNLRKVVWDGEEPPKLKEYAEKMVNMGLYDPMLLEKYSDEDFQWLDRVIDHERDWNFTWTAWGQLKGKYLVKNRATGQIHETPQLAYMFMSMAGMINEEKDKRLEYVKKTYDKISNFEISLPTPIMAGLRTPTRQFSSCVLIDTDDSLDSIIASTGAIIKYISQRAGIGLNVGRLRAINSPIRGGEAVHTGLVPFIKLFQSAVKSCSQGGVRGGAATLFYPLWHMEVEDLLVLKNNRGVEENRARHLDYGVQINKTLYKRLIEGGQITLFSPNDVPDLYEAFYRDTEQFEYLYCKYEKDPNIQKKVIKAIDLFTMLAQERAQTGRIYIHNVDHSNNHSAFDSTKAPVYQSNLCMEITLPTKPLNDINDADGEVALCTLSAINLGMIEADGDESLKESCQIITRLLDNILDYQDYPIPAAKNSAQRRRPLGVGVTNMAYFLAKNNVRYSDGSANGLVHRTFEKIQYYLIESSIELARERGRCELFHETNYAKGILPIDTYSRNVDDICDEALHLDWEKLRKDILKHGMRHSTLTALMPCETSSQITNSTNGIEPPRGYVSVKSSKDGTFKFIVPEIKRLKGHYELQWSMPNNIGYLNLVAIMQKFVDQAISANTNYDPEKFPEGKVPIKQVLKDILHAYKYGVKTLYYHNTRDGANDRQNDEDGCSGGACKL